MSCVQFYPGILKITTRDKQLLTFFQNQVCVKKSKQQKQTNKQKRVNYGVSGQNDSPIIILFNLVCYNSASIIIINNCETRTQPKIM